MDKKQGSRVAGFLLVFFVIWDASRDIRSPLFFTSFSRLNKGKTVVFSINAVIKEGSLFWGSL